MSLRMSERMYSFSWTNLSERLWWPSTTICCSTMSNCICRTWDRRHQQRSKPPRIHRRHRCCSMSRKRFRCKSCCHCSRHSTRWRRPGRRAGACTNRSQIDSPPGSSQWCCHSIRLSYSTCRTSSRCKCSHLWRRSDRLAIPVAESRRCWLSSNFV